MTQAGLTLIIGGARAGKTTFAERLAARHSGTVCYVATAEPRDDEMRARIAAHRSARPSHWTTVEAPLEVATALAEIERPSAVLLDCLTLWTSNLLLRDLDPDAVTPDRARRAETVAVASVTALLRWQSETGVATYIVSNEVGLGVTPPYALGRIFQDVLGRLNQRVAAAASEVYFVVAGMALPLKALGAAGIDAPPPLPLEDSERARSARGTRP
ncbi:MAG: bifunctional adenosylcobinamide kinase/adenosylcobinamide-phosphate guanylyltransferase [Dehalococcoidia bacterium]